MRMTYRSAIVLVFLAIASLQARASWYESYQRGKDAINGQQWDRAVKEFTDAIDDKDESAANARTYGLSFIDYFPYVYRGYAYFKLGQLENATADLDREDAMKAVYDGSKDPNARELLRTTRDAIKAALAARNTQPIAKSEPPKTETPKTEPPKVENAKPETTTKTEVARPAVDTKKLLADGESLFKRGKLDDAEKKFSAVIDADKNNRDAKSYLSRIRTEKSRLASLEADYQQGVRYFNDKKYGLAEAKFRPLAKDRDDAKTYLDRIDGIRKEIDRYVSQGKSEFNRASYDAAENWFTETLKLEPDNRTAKDYLVRINTARGAAASQARTDDAFNKAVALYNAGKLKEAKQQFQLLQTSNPDREGVGQYLNDIAKVEQQSRQGIKQFLEGDYDHSITTLSEVSQHYVDSPTIYAFLAGAYAGKYFLSGGEDSGLMTKAKDAYSHVHAIQRDYELDKTYVSPKIVQLLTINQ